MAMGKRKLSKVLCMVDAYIKSVSSHILFHPICKEVILWARKDLVHQERDISRWWKQKWGQKVPGNVDYAE